MQIEPEQAAVGGAGITVAGKWLLDQLGGQWWKNRAAARKDDAEAETTLADGWRAMVDELRRDMNERDRQCELRLQAMQAQLEAQAIRLSVQARIIVALALHRKLTDDERAIVMELAPAAEPEAKEEHR